MSYRLPSVSRILFFPQKLLKGADDKLALPLSQFQCGKCPAFKRIQAGSEIHTGQHEYYKNGMSSGPAPFPLPPRCSSALPDSLASAHPLFLFLLHSSNTPSTFFFLAHSSLVSTFPSLSWINPTCCTSFPACPANHYKFCGVQLHTQPTKNIFFPCQQAGQQGLIRSESYLVLVCGRWCGGPVTEWWWVQLYRPLV